MSEYKIELPGTKEKAYNRISLLILVINMLAFGLLFFRPNELYGYLTAAIMLLLMSLCLFTYATKNMVLQNKFTIACIGLAAVAWIILGDYMLAILMAVVAVVSYYTLKKPILVFTEDGIQYPSVPSKFYTWPEVKNCMIKADILTLDMKNNQLMQFTLPAEMVNSTELQGFNKFCQEKLKKNN